MKGDIDVSQYALPVPDSKERRHAEKGDYPPYMIDGRKAFIVAAIWKNWAMMNWTLTQGVDINDRDDQGRSLFVLALSLGADKDALEELVKRGADPRVADSLKRSSVHHAILSRQLASLDFLVDRLKLSVEEPDLDGNTPLLYAAATGNPIATKRLLEKWNANVNTVNEDGMNALHYVCSHDNITEKMSVFIMGELFRHKIDKEKPREADGNTPLHLCALNGHDSLVKAILRHISDRTVVNNKGYTPAVLAALSSHTDLAKTIYKKNYNPVSEWTEAHVGEFVLFEMSKYISFNLRMDLLQRFFVYRIDGSQIIAMTNDTLKDMGILAQNLQNLLMDVFTDLRINGPGLPPVVEEKEIAPKDKETAPQFKERNNFESLRERALKGVADDEL